MGYPQIEASDITKEDFPHPGEPSNSTGCKISYLLTYIYKVFQNIRHFIDVESSDNSVHILDTRGSTKGESIRYY